MFIEIQQPLKALIQIEDNFWAEEAMLRSENLLRLDSSLIDEESSGAGEG